MKIPTRDAGIPMLTEIIATPAMAPVGESTHTPAEPAAVPAAAPAPFSADDFERLVDNVRISVLAQLESHYDALLGERLRLLLADRLNTLAADLEADIKAELLRDIQELTVRASTRHAEEMFFNKK